MSEWEVTVQVSSQHAWKGRLRPSVQQNDTLLLTQLFKHHHRQ